MNHPRTASVGLDERAADAAAPWGARTARALEQFAIGGAHEAERMPLELMRALVLLKGVCANVNARLQRLPQPLAHAIDGAATALLAAEPEAARTAPFPLPIWQSAAGAQSHANVDEVLAQLATQGLGDRATVVRADEHVSRGQSCSGMVTGAMHVAVVSALRARLLPALGALASSLQVQAAVLDMLGTLTRPPSPQEPPAGSAAIGAWRSQLLLAGHAIGTSLPALHGLALGGGAADVDPHFVAEVCREINLRTGAAFVPAPDPHAALAGHEPLVMLHGALKALAVALSTIAGAARAQAPSPSDAGPAEALLMVCWQVIGNDLAVTLGAAGGPLQPGAGRPLIVANVLRSIRLLADAMTSFEAHTVRGLVPDAARGGGRVAGSLRTLAALAPHIGLEQATRIAQRAHAEGIGLREAALALGMAGTDFDRWADPAASLKPSAVPPA